MQIITNLFLIAAFTFHDLVPVYRNRQWKVFGTYVAIMVLVVFVQLLISLNVDIPSPPKLLSKLVTFVIGQRQE
jgi:hypothetical protein